VNSPSLHIDLVLRSLGGLLVVECKRVNPAIGLWCFGRSEYGTRNGSASQMVRVDKVLCRNDTGAWNVRRDGQMNTEHQYHVGLETKSGVKGDEQGGGRSALNDSVNQALRASSGLTNTFAEMNNPDLLGPRRNLVVIPVVLTTARLFTCDVDLSEASLEDGRLPADVATSERDWLWYRTNLTRSLRHQVPHIPYTPRTSASAFGEIAEVDYARSVGIVTIRGLQDFLDVASYHAGDRDW
jgi:hypothetical protein